KEKYIEPPLFWKSSKKKYVSELTVVRDCVPTCSEKEWWGARTFCCDTDECNSAFTRSPAIALIALAIVLVFAR
ncbi:unnamed protein product, partial [Brenthis ino]